MSQVTLAQWVSDLVARLPKRFRQIARSANGPSYFLQWVALAPLGLGLDLGLIDTSKVEVKVVELKVPEAIANYYYLESRELFHECSLIQP